jgi:hypothetical protein
MAQKPGQGSSGENTPLSDMSSGPVYRPQSGVWEVGGEHALGSLGSGVARSSLSGR